MSYRWGAALAVVLFVVGAPVRAADGAHDCQDQHNTPCDTGRPGICGEGLWKCSGNGLRCQQTYVAVTEVCGNGDDDDCDGQSDGQDPDCRCRDADGDDWAVCRDGCSLATGDRCGDCDDGSAQINPNRSEVCNGRDDDCDGSQDEGNPGGGAACTTEDPGICAAGTLRCAQGGLHCASNLTPRPEDCDNGLDDDCNGRADEADVACSADCSTVLDSDSDRVADCADNCPGLANQQQQDFDEDGMGDACETGVRVCDINRSGRVDGMDLALLGRMFGRTCSSSGFDRAADLNRDCTVDGEDLALIASLFGHS